jgi:hypothetical protein
MSGCRYHARAYNDSGCGAIAHIRSPLISGFLLYTARPCSITSLSDIPYRIIDYCMVVLLSVVVSVYAVL